MPTCTDWEDRIRNGRSLVPSDITLNEKWAAAGLEMFNARFVGDVTGQPQMGTIADPWFQEIVRVLFGSYDPATKVRAIKEYFILVPKKNGKTAYASTLMLTALMMNERPNAEFMLLGPKKEVSERAFRNVESSILAEIDFYEKQGISNHIGKLLKVTSHTHTVEHLVTRARLRVKSASPDVVQGIVPAGVLVDESHAFLANARSTNVFTQLRGGMASFPEAFMMQITTQSSEPPEGIFKDELKKARDVRDDKAGPKITQVLLPVLYELPQQEREEQAWKNEDGSLNEELVAKITPNLGKSVSMDDLVTNYEGAQTSEESTALPEYLAQRLNVEIDSTTAATRWTAADVWSKGVCEFDLNLETMLEECDVITVGVDTGGYYDLLSLAVLGREKGTRRWLHWGHSWFHEEGIEKYPHVARAIHPFLESGEITLVPKGDSITDQMQIAECIKPLERKMPKKGVMVDQAREIELAEGIVRYGVNPDKMAAMSVGGYLTGAIFGIERKLWDGSFAHAGQEHVQWAVNNARIEPVGTSGVKITKANSAGKIDPVIALLAAAECMSKSLEGGLSRMSGRDFKFLEMGGKNVISAEDG